MAKRSKNITPPVANGATVGYEAQLWQLANALRGSLDAAEYKHVVLGLIFLKYISDTFEEKHALLMAEKPQGANPEAPDEYRAVNVFWVPPEAHWAHLKAQARQDTQRMTTETILTIRWAVFGRIEHCRRRRAGRQVTDN